MWLTILVLALGIALQPSQAHCQSKSTRDLVSSGIGKKHQRSNGLLTFSTWATPLHYVVAPTMSSTLSHDGRLLVVGGGHNYGGQLSIYDLQANKPLLIRPATHGIRRVQFVPHTEHLIVAGFDGKARLIDARTGRLIRQFVRHTDAINGVDISPDGSRLVTGGHDDLVMLWNLETGQHLHTFRGHTDDVLAVAMVPTEPMVVSTGRDKRVLVWNIESGEMVRELTGPEDFVDDITVSNDGKVIAAASADGKTWLWDRETGVVQGTLPSQRGRMACVDFSPDGRFLAAGGFDGQITVWDYAQRAEIARITHPGALFAVTFQEDGTHLVSNNWNGNAKLWKTDGNLVADFPIPPAEQRNVKLAAWAPDESCLAVLDQAGGIRLFDGADCREINNFRLEATPATALGFTGDGQLVAGHADGSIRTISRSGEASPPLDQGTSTFAGVIRIATLGSKSILAQFQDGKAVRVDLQTSKVARIGESSDIVQFAADSGLDWFATLHKAGIARFWDSATGKPLEGELSFQGQAPQLLAATSVGSRLLCTTTSGIVNQRITRSGDQVHSDQTRLIPVSNGPLLSLAISPDGQTLAAGLPDITVRVMGIDGVLGGVFKRENTGGPSVAVGFGPRSQRLVTITQNGQGWLWDIGQANAEPLPLATLAAHEKGARFVSFAQNDKSLVTEGYDNKAWVWDLESGDRRQIKGKDSTSALAVAPDSTKVAVGQFPGRLDLRDLASLEMLREYTGSPRGAYSLSFSPDQTRIIATFYDKDLSIYDVASPAPALSLGPASLPWTYATFSPDGRTFVTCTGDYKQQSTPGSIRLHDSPTGKVLMAFEGHGGEVKYASFDRAGKRLVTTSSDKTIRTYDVATGKQLHLLKQPDTAFCAEFIPDSDLLVTGDYKGHLRLWELPTTTVVQSLRAHSDWIQRVAFSRDLSTLATAGRDGAVKLWSISGTGNSLRVFGSSE